MRTTISLEGDIAAALKRRSTNRSFESTVNEVLRVGLQVLEAAEKEAYRTVPVRGNPKLKNLDRISEVITGAEAPTWR